MVTRADPSGCVALLTGDREAGTLPTITSYSYQPFLLQKKSATIACLKAGLLCSPSPSLRNPAEWYTLQSIMLLAERPLACASCGQPSTTPMPSFTRDLATTCIPIKIVFNSAGPGLNVMPEKIISHLCAKPSYFWGREETKSNINANVSQNSCKPIAKEIWFLIIQNYIWGMQGGKRGRASEAKIDSGRELCLSHQLCLVTDSSI